MKNGQRLASYGDLTSIGRSMGPNFRVADKPIQNAIEARWVLNSNGLRSGSGCRLSCRKSNIKLWRNDQAQDWSIEIHGLLHEHVSSEIMEDLVECALIVAEKSWTEASTRRAVVGREGQP